MRYILLAAAAFGAFGSAVADARGLVTPTFLLPYAANAHFIDYRPAVNAAGTRIVFERQLPSSDGTGYGATIDLYISDLVKPSPTRLVTAFSQTTRPDWCQQRGSSTADGPIAFSAGTAPATGSTPGATYAAQPGIYTIAQPTAPYAARYVAGNATWIYPTWYPDCATLAVDSSLGLPNPRSPDLLGPTTIQVDAGSGAVGPSLSGTRLWAGFPSVNPRSPRLLTFAGQQFNASGYNQNLNYIYIANSAGRPPRVTPLDESAPINRFVARFQGRAPSWSPDGRWVAFETNRACALPTSGAYYAIFLQDAEGQGKARQVTDCGYDAQHAKWFKTKVHGRTLLITTVRLYPSYTGTDLLMLNARGIAALDVTSLLPRNAGGL